ncbi:MAG: GTP cyclohydrolase II [Anaerolineae bacterium]|nr:GTP cyclohydrolase II [Anaerolineae bacterium]
MNTNTVNVTQVVSSRIPTDYGEFHLSLYTNDQDEKEHLAYILGDVSGQENVLVRVHSECFTGDVLGSKRCDCGEQLGNSLAMIVQQGQGVLVYMRQEGRGIGLKEKLRAYNLQDQGFDTVDANIALGHQADSRDYSITAAILENIGVRSIRLLTNNPAKIEDLRAHGVKVVERIPILPTLNIDNEAYIRTKVFRMDHLLDFSALEREPTIKDHSSD